ncbi:MAG: hypothetical protein HYY92_01935 [Parcubacteria group bacterium]|nr:hypothetical protein [Parcubacteria group bacterium]
MSRNRAEQGKKTNQSPRRHSHVLENMRMTAGEKKQEQCDGGTQKCGGF